MPENVYNYEMEHKATLADDLWNVLPEITRIAIWEDLKGFEDATVGHFDFFIRCST